MSVYKIVVFDIESNIKQLDFSYLFALKIYLIPYDVDNKMMGHMVLELGYVHLGALAKLSTSYKCSQNVEQHHWSKSSISVEDLIFLWLHKAYKVFFLITLCSFSPLLLKKYEIESTDTETCWRLHVYCVSGLYVDFAVKSSQFMKKRRILNNMYLHVDHTETPTYNRQIKNTELLFEISLKINLIESDCKKIHVYEESLSLYIVLFP